MAEHMDVSRVRIAVLGTGANGAGIGADLAEAGLDVTFIDQWPENVMAIRERGVRVEMAGGLRTVPVRVLHLCEVATLVEPFDVVLVLVKAYDTRWACELIKPHVASAGVVVGVQNGMTGDVIVDVMGGQRALAAVIEVTAAMYEPGLVERHSSYDRSWFAVGAPAPAARRHVPVVAEILRKAGVVEEVEDITSPKWMKLVLNAGELVPSAILDQSIADCARVPGMREVMIDAGNEAIELAGLDGITVRPILGVEGDEACDPSTFMQTILDELVQNYVLAHSRSTVLQDWIKGRRAEVEDINGLVVSGLARHGRPAPANQAMVELALQIESGARVRGLHNLEPMLARISELKGAVVPPAAP
ncbi:MAG: ketopantoate reductase family protein [Candidatus Nanopelagicales bacterium]